MMRVVDYSHLIPDLRAGERVVMLRRRHMAVLARRLLPPLVILACWVLLLFVVSLLSPKGANTLEGGWASWALLLGWAGVVALLALWIAYVALAWSDQWIALTTRRVIIMDKVLFLRETRREAPVLKVQNVTAEYPNVFGTTFDFGNVRIDTAGVGVLTFE